MAVSRGKAFELMFRKAVEELVKKGEQIDLQRLFDVIGMKAICQPSDFICYKHPNIIYIECKSTNSNSLSYVNQVQFERLQEKVKIEGVKAGFVVWFVAKKKVFWVDIKYLTAYAQTGVKSINVTKLGEACKRGVEGVYEVDQITKRINPKMNLKGLFEYIVKE